MTFGEFKRAIAGGTLSEAARAESAAMVTRVQPIVAQFLAAHAAYKSEAEALYQVAGPDARLIDVETHVKANPPSAGAIAYLIGVARDALLSEKAKHAADQGHSLPGKSRDRRTQIQAIWASGKYTSRDRCAEEECGALGMSFATARKSLRGTPNPD